MQHGFLRADWRALRCCGELVVDVRYSSIAEKLGFGALMMNDQGSGHGWPEDSKHVEDG